MIELFLKLALLVVAYVYLTRYSIPRQVRNHQAARVATLTKMQAIPRVKAVGSVPSVNSQTAANGATSGTHYVASPHTPSGGTSQI